MTLPRGELPPINFAEKSVTEIQSAIITTYEAIANRTLQPADPVRLFLEAIAAIIVNQRSIIDFAAKQNLLSYAQDIFIDYIGELVGVKRLEAKPAQTTLRFTLSIVQAGTFTIPAGTLVTTGTVSFATTEILDIPAGDLTGEVIAECAQAGTIGNSFLPGQIRTLVQPIAFVQAVTNITTSNGGAERESDESLVARIRLAPSSFSVAGPVDAYRYWALTANPGIIDVAVFSPSPGIVDVRPLMTGGTLPGPEVLQQVLDILSADDIRDLTALVQANSPVGVNYTLSVEYWIRSDDAARSVAIQNAVTAAVNDYVMWQKTRIGRDITPDQLTQRMISAGAKRVNIISPSFTVLGDDEVAQDTAVNVNYQGLEDA